MLHSRKKKEKKMHGRKKTNLLVGKQKEKKGAW